MEAEIKAGAKINFLTSEELRAELADWLAEIKRGVRFVRGTMSAVVVAAGTVSVGTVEPSTLGPKGSIVWAIPRITVAGLTAGQSVDLYVNDTSAASKIATVTAAAGYILFESTGLLLNPNDKLIAIGSALTVGATITVNAQIVELPVQLAWQLI